MFALVTVVCATAEMLNDAGGEDYFDGLDFHEFDFFVFGVFGHPPSRRNRSLEFLPALPLAIARDSFRKNFRELQKSAVYRAFRSSLSWRDNRN